MLCSCFRKRPCSCKHLQRNSVFSWAFPITSKGWLTGRLLLPFLTCLRKSSCNPSPVKGSPLHLNIAIPVTASCAIWLTCLSPFTGTTVRKKMWTSNLFFIEYTYDFHAESLGRIPKAEDPASIPGSVHEMGRRQIQLCRVTFWHAYYNYYYYNFI